MTISGRNYAMVESRALENWLVAAVATSVEEVADAPISV